MSDKNARIDTLPPTTAGLSQALDILQEATGCPDSVADALLSGWDVLNVAYSGAVIALDILPMLEAEAKERQLATLKQGGIIPDSQRIDERETGRAAQQAAEIAQTNRQYVADAKTLRDEAPSLPVRVADEVYQVALL